MVTILLYYIYLVNIIPSIVCICLTGQHYSDDHVKKNISQRWASKANIKVAIK